MANTRWMSKSERTSKLPFTLKGQRQLVKNLRAVAERLGPLTYGGAMATGLLKLQALAIPMTPVDTGYLRSTARSLMTEANDNGAKGMYYYTAPYASEIEEKTQFLKNAVDLIIPTLTADFKNALNKGMFSKDMA